MPYNILNTTDFIFNVNIKNIVSLATYDNTFIVQKESSWWYDVLDCIKYRKYDSAIYLLEAVFKFHLAQNGHDASDYSSLFIATQIILICWFLIIINV